MLPWSVNRWAPEPGNPKVLQYGSSARMKWWHAHHKIQSIAALREAYWRRLGLR